MSVTEPLVVPGSLTLVLDAAADSITGPRADNQDAGLAAPRLVAVADGVGGNVGGATAAALVVERLRRGADLANPEGADLVGAVEAANRDLADAVARDASLASMATTLTAATLTREGRLVLVQIGDSRAYLWRRGELVRLTTDQTLVQTLLDSGAITAEEALVHPLRSVVLAALHGRPGDPADVEVSVLPVEPGDRLLLCTDGLSGAVSPATLAAVLSEEDSPAAAVRRLLRAALAGRTQDNATAVVADVRVTTQEPAATTSVVGAAQELFPRS